MTYAAGLPRYHLDNLRYMLAKGVQLKMVMIGLDEFDYKYDPAEEFNDYLRYPYPPAVHQSRALFYLKYLVRYSSKTMSEAFEGYEGKRRPIPYDHYGTGLKVPDPKEEAKIDADPVTYAKDPRFQIPLNTIGDRMDAALEEIREIVDLLKAHGIRLIVFMNPIHKTTYLDYRPGESCFLFEKELSKITSFYDFSGLNSITTNNAYYLETSPLHVQGRRADSCPHTQRQQRQGTCGLRCAGNQGEYRRASCIPEEPGRGSRFTSQMVEWRAAFSLYTIASRGSTEG